MNKKYVLTDNTIDFMGRKLYQIKAITSVGADVKPGDLGGWIESEHNLSQENNSWVYDNAKVLDDAIVYDCAILSKNAIAYDYARIGYNSVVTDNSLIFGHAAIKGSALVSENAAISGFVTIDNRAEIYGNAKIKDHCYISGSVRIYGNAEVSGNVGIFDNIEILGNTKIDSTYHYDIYGNIKFKNNANIHRPTDFVNMNNLPSMGKALFFRDENNNIKVSSPLYYGNLEDFIIYVKSKYVYQEETFMKIYDTLEDYIKLVILGDY